MKIHAKYGDETQDYQVLRFVELCAGRATYATNDGTVAVPTATSIVVERKPLAVFPSSFCVSLKAQCPKAVQVFDDSRTPGFL
jgi:hypothetical protein